MKPTWRPQQQISVFPGSVVPVGRAQHLHPRTKTKTDTRVSSSAKWIIQVELGLWSRELHAARIESACPLQPAFVSTRFLEWEIKD
jgi:hypothetical protein